MKGVILWLMCWVGTAWAGPVEDGYAQFIEGDLAAAAETWDQALEAGAGSASLH